jgi:hypothetical protein
MVIWFSRKNKSASRGGQATQSRKVYPPPSHGYYNASSSGNQAATSAIVQAPLDSSYRNNDHEAPHQKLIVGSTLVNYSSPVPPSQPPPCDVCAVWIKAFENLPPDDFVRSRAYLGLELPICSREGLPSLPSYSGFIPQARPVSRRCAQAWECESLNRAGQGRGWEERELCLLHCGRWG